MYVPAGFADGFLALTDTVQFLYKCSDFYIMRIERGIARNDPDLAIEWGMPNPLISPKDAASLTLAAKPREFLPQFPGN